MKKSKNYLITGITGFVGINILKKYINKKNIKIFYTYRNKNLPIKGNNTFGIKINLENINELDKLKDILKKIDIIIHCANLAHNKYSKRKIELINYFASTYLAKLAKNYNVKKFIFLSTAKINMNYDKTINNENDISYNIKNDFYTYIKYKTEKKLINIFKNSNVNWIILRPALLYGKYVKGNFEKLQKLTRLPFLVPLPFLKAVNKKSLCSIKNLIDSIDKILSVETKNNTFLICDNTQYSLKDILTQIYRKKNKKIYLFSLNLIWIRLFFILLNKKNIYDSMFSTMILSNSKIKNNLNIKLNHNLYNTFF